MLATVAFVHWRTAWTRSLLAVKLLPRRCHTGNPKMNWLNMFSSFESGTVQLMIWLQWATSDITHWILLKIRLNYQRWKDVFAMPTWWERGATMQILGKRKATVCSVPWEMMIEKSKRYAMPFKYCNIATPCQSTFGIAFNYLYQLRKSVCVTPFQTQKLGGWNLKMSVKCNAPNIKETTYCSSTENQSFCRIINLVAS